MSSPALTQLEIQIPMSTGVTDAVLVTPSASTPLPGIIHLTDIGGIRPAHIQMASELASHGYTVLLPNVFHRTSRPPVLTVDRADQEAVTRRIRELLEPLTPPAVEDDAYRYIDFLLAQKSVASSKPIGVVGYCGTGSHPMRYAAARPDQVAAGASFHGTYLYADDPKSPHLLLPRIKARLYFGHASNDPYMPAASILALEASLRQWGGEYESETYSGASHSWMVPDSPLYNPSQAARGFEKLTALFAETLT